MKINICKIIELEMQYEKAMQKLNQVNKLDLYNNTQIDILVEYLLNNIFWSTKNSQHHYFMLISLCEWLIKTFGRILTCRSTSLFNNKFITLLDSLDQNRIKLNNYSRNPDVNMFLKKFKNLLISMGAKYAHEIFDHHMLEEILCDPDYRNWVLQELDYTYLYSTLKESKLVLHNELIEELYKPNRIQKWITQGNELLDYLN